MRIKLLFEWEWIPGANYRPVGLWAQSAADFEAALAEALDEFRRNLSVVRFAEKRVRLEELEHLYDATPDAWASGTTMRRANTGCILSDRRPRKRRGMRPRGCSH